MQRAIVQPWRNLVSTSRGYSMYLKSRAANHTEPVGSRWRSACKSFGRSDRPDAECCRNNATRARHFAKVIFVRSPINDRWRIKITARLTP